MHELRTVEPSAAFSASKLATTTRRSLVPCSDHREFRLLLMAKRSKSAPARLVVSRTNQSWRSMTCWGFSLAVLLLLLVILFGDQSEDMYIDHSIWSEVYMPDKYGVGVVAKKNILVRTLTFDLSSHYLPVPSQAWNSYSTRKAYTIMGRCSGRDAFSAMGHRKRCEAALS
jgi:hypothetical protein